MLSPRDDEDDDSHLCIKCDATIVGLDNYIQHRKRRCGKTKTETSKADISTIVSMDPTPPTYNLGADVFFQSLELQSSVKKTSLSRLTPPVSSKSIKKNPLVLASTSRHTPRMSPLETNLRGEDWIGGHSLRIGDSEDNETKLINAVVSISGGVKKDIPTSAYSLAYNDFNANDESEESDVSDEDDEEVRNVTKWKPPPNHTGGKWRLASPEQEEWDMREEQEHTGGKWKPFLPDANEREEDYDAPPPEHTKGKWVPGTHEKAQIMQTTIQSKGSVLYWCGACNRRLGSRAIYEKHLMSNLHMRKVLPENELEFSGHLEPIKNIAAKRTTRPSRFINDSIYSQLKRKKQKVTEFKLNLKIGKKKRKRKLVFIRCTGCKSRVRQHLMGKHLISHYHFRKATETQSTSYQQLILDNIDAIVHQSPYQCSPCKFYTNWQSCFVQHWLSEQHEQIISSMDGRLWCSFCKFETESNQEMLEHMSSSDHTEVVAVVNRSMPIVMRKKTILQCKVCLKEFRYNIELKRHSISAGHQLAYSASDEYQELHKCQLCSSKFKSSLTLAAHLKSNHKQRVHFCLVCSKTFNSSEDAKRHRQTSEHRIRRKINMSERGLPIKDLSKKCPYCTEKVTLKNVLELKEHIRLVHPNIKKKCPKCGMSFILSQEVSRHVRANACQFENNAIMSSIIWNCSQCSFNTDSQAECFFHETLHMNPIKEIRKIGEEEKLVLKYPCPICSKVYRKASLRQHLRQHTFERPFICSICGANFTRQTSLANHSKNEHGADGKITKLPTIVDSTDECLEEFVCGSCKKRFPNKTSLTRHIAGCVHVAKDKLCPYAQCSYVATSFVQLAKHRRIHGDRIKQHECNQCSYKTDQASHLKRHMLMHKEIKPYCCPHCDFTCGSLENLRKHVLQGARHLGLFLYHCTLCEYRTNTATELRAHLKSAHSDKFHSQSTIIEAVKMVLMKRNK